MALKSDPNFEEKPILGSKYHMSNLVNFNVSNSNSENFHFAVCTIMLL